MENQDIITTAEQLVAELWETKKTEEIEVVQDVPACAEAVEDEIKMLEAAANAYIQQKMREEGTDYMKLHGRILDIDRMVGADMSLWSVGVCIEGHCDPKCTNKHHCLKRFFIAKRNDGSCVVLRCEEIYNVAARNEECFAPPGAIRINLSDLIDQSLGNAIKEKVEEIMQSKDSGGSGGGDDDGLPPAATIEETTAPLAGGEDDDGLPPAAVVEEAPVTVEYRRIAVQDEPSMLQRAWKRLWRRS